MNLNILETHTRIRLRRDQASESGALIDGGREKKVGGVEKSGGANDALFSALVPESIEPFAREVFGRARTWRMALNSVSLTLELPSSGPSLAALQDRTLGEEDGR